MYENSVLYSKRFGEATSCFDTVNEAKLFF